MLERPKRNVARAWGLAPGATFVALPHRVLAVLREPVRKLDARHVVTMIAIADRWHSDQGPVFQTSLRELAQVVGLPYSNVNRTLLDLAASGLLIVTREPGKPMMIDLTPLLRAIQPKAALKSKATVPPTEQRTVPPTEQNCSATVPPTERNCSTSRLPVGTDFRDRGEDGVRDGAASVRFAPAPPSLATENGTANGHGNGVEKDAVRAGLELLTRKPGPNRIHPRAQPGESYADTQKRLATEG